MYALIYTELLKLRTTRWPLALLPVAMGLTGAMALSPALKAGTAGAPSVGTAGALLAVLAATGIGSLVALVAGVLIVTDEVYRDTLTTGLLRAPRRGFLLASKAVTAALFALVIGVADLLVMLAIGLISGILTSDLINADILLRTGGLVAAYPLYAVLGVGLGALLHYQPVAVALPVFWALFLEDLLIRADSPLWPWTLRNVSAALANAGDIAGLIPVWAGALTLGGYALAAAALGGFRLILRDIT